MKKIRHKYITIFFIILISIIVSLILEFAIFNKDYFINNKLQSYSYEIPQEQLEETDNLYRIIKLKDVNTYVNSIKFEVSKTTENFLYDVTIEHNTKNNDNFIPENNIYGMFQKKQKYMDIKREIKDLNLNIKLINSKFTDRVFNISINPVEFKFHINRVIFLSIFIALILILLIKNKNKIINKSFIKNPIVITIISICIIRILYSALIIIHISADSNDYINVDPLYNFLNFKIDEHRVPIYPAILDIFEYIFSEKFFLNSIIYFQFITSIISSYLLYKSILIVSKLKSLSIIITILYSLNPAIIQWNKSILTESLSLSGTIILIYFIVEYLFNNSSKHMIWSIILSSTLIFLRPTFLVFFLLLIGLYIFKLIFEKQKIAKLAIIVSIPCCMLVALYSFIFYNQYGNISLSNTLLRQQFWICIYNQYYIDIENQEVINQEVFNKALEIEKYGTVDDTIVYLDSIYNTPQKKLQFIKESLKGKKLTHINKTFENIAKHTNIQYTGYYLKNTQTFYNTGKHGPILAIKNYFFNLIIPMFGIIYFHTVYWIIALELLLIFYYIFKKKQLPIINLGLFAFPTVIIISTFFGTNAEYMRTSICVLPFVYFIIAYEISNLFSKYKEKDNFNEKKL